MGYPCQLVCNDTDRINRPLLMAISMPEPSIGPEMRSSGSLNHSSDLRLSTSQRKPDDNNNNNNKSRKRRPAPLAQNSGQRMMDVFRAASIEDARICGDWSFGASQFLEWSVLPFPAGFLLAFVSCCNGFSAWRDFIRPERTPLHSGAGPSNRCFKTAVM
jgi:hypothetical protein